ncbi:MAG TPA: hypothetical protein VHE59_16995 [Mucilaginibacter sp.]|nr:hypothetical protein [Mucilaginibacter sp.]
MKCLNFCLSAFCIIISSSLFAQTPKQIEADLRKSFEKVRYWEEHKFDTTTNISGYDSIQKANRIFQAKLKRYTSKYPFTLDQKFTSISDLSIKTSANKQLRIYSWDDGTGGTLRNYKAVIQFKSSGKIYSLIAHDAAFYNGVYQLNYKGKTYYLAEYFIQAMSSYFGQGIEVWAIENNSLNRQVKIFKTAKGIKSQIDYAYWYDDKLNGDLKYDEKTNTLSIPATAKGEKLTGKRILYKFTGQYFERVKN